MARTSARDWLLKMPEVFSVAEMALVMECGVARRHRCTLHAGGTTVWVKGLGGKSGVFITRPSMRRAGAGQIGLGARRAQGHAIRHHWWLRVCSPTAASALR